MNKRLSALLEEILASAQLVRTYTTSLSKEDFLASTQVQDAVLRRIEIVGEGVKSIPPEWKDAHSEIPGVRSRGCATFSVHRYFSVDLEVVWQTATHDLPDLEGQLSGLLDELREQEAASADDSPA